MPDKWVRAALRSVSACRMAGVHPLGLAGAGALVLLAHPDHRLADRRRMF